MSSDNPVADRLLNDARKKGAREQSPTLAIIGIVVGAVGVVGAFLSPIVGWVLGAVAIGLGVPGVQRPTSAKQSKIAMLAGAAAVLVGVFFFTKYIANN
jgi:hypothetical protein